MPWRPEFTCWDTVRLVQREEFGRELPQLSIGDSLRRTQDKILLSLIGKEGLWRKTLRPRAGDIMVCQGVSGPHVGVMVSGTHVLHNVGSVTRPGSVRKDRIPDLALAGFQRAVFWGPENG